MKSLRSIPRILKINKITGYYVSCLFSNGESRAIDFKNFFKRDGKRIKKNHPSYKLTTDIKEFTKVELIGNSLGWRNAGIWMKDFSGIEKFYPYELDPIVLYEFSEKDEKQSLQIGKKIKTERLKAGLTQEQLAIKSGTSKHYISRLENSKSDIELLTLKKIVEAGLGKEMEIEIY
ncbi:MAG: helix-turn-helix transcriptional regulator [Saprospiraceae bacterium]